MNKRTALGAAAFSLALAGGGVAGAVLGTPSVSLAQDDTSESTTQTDDGSGTDEVRAKRGPGPRLTAAAETLGMSEEDLAAELRDGKSLAEVAEDQGVDVQDVIDALVAEGTERLEERIAELPDHVAELVEREGLPGRGHRHGPRPGPGRGSEGERPADDEAESDESA